MMKRSFKNLCDVYALKLFSQLYIFSYVMNQVSNFVKKYVVNVKLNQITTAS